MCPRVTPNTVKLGPGRGQPGLSSADMRSASTWHSTKGISWSPSKGAIINRVGERVLDTRISVPAWVLDYSLCPGPGLVANIFQMKSFHNGQHQADKGEMKLLPRLGAGEWNIHLTEYLVYQICKCRVLEYFVCAHLKFGNIYRAWLLPPPPISSYVQQKMWRLEDLR